MGKATIQIHDTSGKSFSTENERLLFDQYKKAKTEEEIKEVTKLIIAMVEAENTYYSEN